MTHTKLHGTKTEQNLINAFAGESQARNRYSYFAKQAKEDGYDVSLLNFQWLFIRRKMYERTRSKGNYFSGNIKENVRSISSICSKGDFIWQR